MMRSSPARDSRRTPIVSRCWAGTVPARSCRFSRSAKLPRRSSIEWSRPLAGEWERYLRQQIELGGAEIVLSRAAGRSGGPSVTAEPEAVPSDRLTARPPDQRAARPPDQRPARPPDRPSARPSWQKGCPPIPGTGLSVESPTHVLDDELVR